MRRIRRKKDRSNESEAQPGPDDADDADDGVNFDDLITRELGSPSVTDFGEDRTIPAPEDGSLAGPRVDVTLEGSDAENARLRAELLNPPAPTAGPSAAATVAAARASVMTKASPPAMPGSAPTSPTEPVLGETPLADMTSQDTPTVDMSGVESSRIQSAAVPASAVPASAEAASVMPAGVMPSVEVDASPQAVSDATADADSVLEPHDALIVPPEPNQLPATGEPLQETPQPRPRPQTQPQPISAPGGRGASGFSQLGFWDRYEEATAAAELFTVPPAAVTVVIGSLDVAVPIVERCQSNHWVSDCEVFVLSEREQVPGQPTWTMVRRPSEIVSVLESGESDFPLLVIDVPRELPAWIRPLIVRLRQGGVGLVHYVLGDDPSDEDLATWHGELGRPSVLDLAAPVGPDRVLELLDRGEPISSVAGMPISTELLLALRLNRG